MGWKYKRLTAVCDLLIFVGEVISNVVIDMRHVARIIIVRVVTARETWSFLSEELSFVNDEDEAPTLSRPRRWMRHHRPSAICICEVANSEIFLSRF